MFTLDNSSTTLRSEDSETRFGNRTVIRGRLLAPMTRVDPEIVGLIAPAGFGKSTLARQFVEGERAWAVCDCAGVADDLDFARRLLPALADENPERGAALSQRELMLGDGTMSAAERIEIAVAAWRSPSRPATMIFDSAEHVVRSASARELLIRLLAERPANRRIVLCSRDEPRVHLTRFAQPHRIVVLRADDLAFTKDEVEELLGAPAALDAATLARIVEISQGWPVPALFLARLALEGRHEAVLERLDAVAFEELYEYLADHVIALLPPDLVAVLFAAAAIPGATDVDLTVATGDPAAPERLAQFARTSPFVQCSGDDTYVVHPLMRAMLTERSIARRDTLLAETARSFESRGDYLRAAELHLAAGDQEAAAEALENIRVGEDRAPSMRYSRMVSSLDRSIVRRFPTLWACSAMLQTFAADTTQLLEETGSLWATLPPTTPLYKRYYVLATRVLMLVYIGRFEDALKLLVSSVPPQAWAETPTTVEQGYALYLRGTVVARLGHLDDAEHDLRRAWALVEPMDVMASAVLVIQGAEIARIRGDRDAERELLERSFEYAKRSQLVNFVAYRVAEAAFGAWFAGEDALFRRHAEELDRIVHENGIRGFRYFAARARGREPGGSGSDGDLLRFVICGNLIACASADDRVAALQHAEAARSLSADYPNPFLQALAFVACAELDVRREAEWYAAARDAAGRAGAKAFAGAVEAAAGGGSDTGMLAPMLRRLRDPRRETEPRIEIAILRGTVRCRGREITPTDREFALLVALARAPEPTSREALVEVLWPDSDVDAALNTLKVYVHRLRQRLGDGGAIVGTRAGLRLCDEARVDLWEIRRELSSIRMREIVDEADRRAVADAYARLRFTPGREATWEWFDPTARWIREVRCELAQRLARHFIRTERFQEALDLANEMIEYDPCDEAATEIAIEAYLGMGEHGMALRHFRHYRDVLETELQCEPSQSLKELIGTT